MADGNPPVGLDQQPVIDGQDPTTGKAIAISGQSNVTIRNLTIRNCEYGIQASTSLPIQRITVRNVVCYNLGPPAVADYGYGVLIYDCDTPGSPSLVKNCRFLNVGGYACWVTKSVNIKVLDCEAYCDEEEVLTGSNGTDYYFLLSSSSDCQVQNCRAERIRKLGGDWPSHAGHAFMLQGTLEPTQGPVETVEPCERNVVKDCEAHDIAESYWFIGKHCKDNVVEVCKGFRSDDEQKDIHNSVFFSNGASENTFRQSMLKKSRGAIGFSIDPRSDAAATGPEWPSSGNLNLVENCIFEECENAVNFFPYHGDAVYEQKEIKASNNTIRNCTFTGRPAAPITQGYTDTRGVFYATRGNENTLLQNCIISGFTGIEYTTSDPLNWPWYFQVDRVFDHCCFYNIGVGSTNAPPFPTSQSAMDADPDFTDCILSTSTDPIGNHSTYQPSYICVDTGTHYVIEQEDYDGTARNLYSNVDIGAQEYGN